MYLQIIQCQFLEVIDGLFRHENYPWNVGPILLKDLRFVVEKEILKHLRVSDFMLSWNAAVVCFGQVLVLYDVFSVSMEKAGEDCGFIYNIYWGVLCGEGPNTS